MPFRCRYSRKYLTAVPPERKSFVSIAGATRALICPALCVFTVTHLRPVNARLAGGLALGAALLVPTYNLIWHPVHFLSCYPPTPASVILRIVNG